MTAFVKKTFCMKRTHSVWRELILCVSWRHLCGRIKSAWLREHMLYEENTFYMKRTNFICVVTAFVRQDKIWLVGGADSQVCVCVCVCARALIMRVCLSWERESEIERKGERESVCVCVWYRAGLAWHDTGLLGASLSTECVLLLQSVFSYYTECVLLLQSVFSYRAGLTRR